MSSGATEITHKSLLEVTSPEAGSPEQNDLLEAGLSKEIKFFKRSFSLLF